MTAQNSLEDMLSAVTDNLLKGERNRQREKLDSQMVESQALVDLIFRLNETLVEVEPSAQFSRQLRAELTGTESGLVSRVRHLPPRVRLVAALMAVAGFVLFLRRRFFTGGLLPVSADVAEVLPNQ